MAAAISPFMRLYCNAPIAHDMNDVQCVKGRSYPFPTAMRVLLRPLRFDQWKKDERDKANGLTLSLNDAIILKGLWHASAHVRHLDFCSGERFFKLQAFGEEILFHRPWNARESHNISIQELFGSHFKSFKWQLFCIFVQALSRKFDSKSLRRSARSHVCCCQCSYTDKCSV